MIDITLPFITAMRALSFIRFHEWHEPRPGYVICPECRANYEATPIGNRRHRSHCVVPGLIKELQTVLVEAAAEEGSDTMPFPKTREALKENGYMFSHTKTCEACNVTIEMWITPRSNLMPLDFKTIENQEVCEPHFATCKKPELYSRRLREKKERQTKPTDDAPILPDEGLRF